MNSTTTIEPNIATRPAILIRSIGWCSLSFLLGFTINNFLSIGYGYPGAIEFFINPSLKKDFHID